MAATLRLSSLLSRPQEQAQSIYSNRILRTCWKSTADHYSLSNHHSSVPQRETHPSVFGNSNLKTMTTTPGSDSSTLLEPTGLLDANGKYALTNADVTALLQYVVSTLIFTCFIPTTFDWVSCFFFF